jgi:hypothetical protein
MKETISMRLKKVFSTLSCMLLACGVAFAQPEQFSQPGVSKFVRDAHTLDPTYTPAEVQKMMHNATSSADYTKVADYFDYRAMEYEQKTQDQIKELQRLLALPYHSRTYQSQVDYTRDHIKLYRAKAEKFSTQADAYRDRANTTTQTK